MDRCGSGVRAELRGADRRRRSRRWSPDCRRAGGCSTSAAAPVHSSQAARDGGTEAVAVELDPDMAALAASRLGTDVTVAGLPDLPFADDGFDTVVASFVLNHVEDPRAGARELVRVAAPGGSVRATIWTSAPTAARRAVPASVMEASRRRRAGLPPPARAPRLRALASTGCGSCSPRPARRWSRPGWSTGPGGSPRRPGGRASPAVGNFGVVWRGAARRGAGAHARRRSTGWPRRCWRTGPWSSPSSACVLVEARVPRS